MPDDYQELEDPEALIMQLEAGTFTLQCSLFRWVYTSYGDTLPPVCQPDLTHSDKVFWPSLSVVAYILEVIRFRCQRPGNEAVLCTCYKYLCIVQYCMHNRL